MLRNIALAGALAAASAFPPPLLPVVDDAQLVPSAVERRVEAELLDFQQRTGITIAVAIVADTAPLNTGDYTSELAAAWGLGGELSPRAVLLVLDAGGDDAALYVAPELAEAFPVTAQRRLLADHVAPEVAMDDEAAALEVGARELRRALGDTTVPPSVAPPTTVARDLDLDGSDGGGSAPAIGGALLGGTLLVASLFVVRRRRFWARRSPVLWGTGWGRAVAGPRASVHRRYRRVRDAVHVAEAETGLPLCFWLGPVVGEDPGALADALFAEAEHEGHAAALVLLAADRPYAELRVAGWARERLGAVSVDDLPTGSKVEALERVADEIAAGGGSYAAPGRGGVPPPRRV